MHQADVVLEHLPGDVLRQPAPVAVVVRQVVIGELDDLRHEPHEPVAGTCEIRHVLDVLHDGVSVKERLVDGDPVLVLPGVLLVKERDAKRGDPELLSLWEQPVEGQELLMVPHLDVKGVVRLATVNLVDLADLDVGIPLEQGVHLLLELVPRRFDS